MTERTVQLRVAVANADAAIATLKSLGAEGETALVRVLALETVGEPRTEAGRMVIDVQEREITTVRVNFDAWREEVVRRNPVR